MLCAPLPCVELASAITHSLKNRLQEQQLCGACGYPKPSGVNQCGRCLSHLAVGPTDLVDAAGEPEDTVAPQCYRFAPFAGPHAAEEKVLRSDARGNNELDLWSEDVAEDRSDECLGMNFLDCAVDWPHVVAADYENEETDGNAGQSAAACVHTAVSEYTGICDRSRVRDDVVSIDEAIPGWTLPQDRQDDVFLRDDDGANQHSAEALVNATTECGADVEDGEEVLIVHDLFQLSLNGTDIRSQPLQTDTEGDAKDLVPRFEPSGLVSGPRQTNKIRNVFAVSRIFSMLRNTDILPKCPFRNGDGTCPMRAWVKKHTGTPRSSRRVANCNTNDPLDRNLLETTG